MQDSIKQRAIILAVILVVGALFLAPTVFRDSMEGWPLSKPLSLGLDLSGGVSITYEVQAEEAVVSYLESVATDARRLLLDNKVPVVRTRALKSEELQVTLSSSRSVDTALELIDAEYPELSMKTRKPEGERLVLTFGIGALRREQLMSSAVDQAIESLRNRVDQFGVAEPLINRVGERRILLQMPGVTDVEKVKRIVGKTAKLEFRFLPKDNITPAVFLKDRQGGQVRAEDRVVMAGDKVKAAKVRVAPGAVEVELQLTRAGGKQFSQLTAENVGRQLAIVLDGVVYSSPVIREQISGGSAVISGDFDIEEANELSIVLKAGALPASLKEMDQLIVGPSLGQESIRSGVLAIVGGFVAILIFMAWYYRMSGLLAVFTLVVNLFLLLALLSMFGATLTLPGLAGLALTIGIAVDSNIIIFERIRDELKNGASMKASVEGGFAKAFSAIIDTNITALITGIILFVFGSGPVKGFAVTLSVGVLTTILGATFVARVAFDFVLLKRKGEVTI